MRKPYEPRDLFDPHLGCVVGADLRRFFGQEHRSAKRRDALVKFL